MIRFKITVLFCLILSFMNMNTGNAAGAVKIAYVITFPEAQAHYADIEMTIAGLQQNSLDVKMPVWTPGSYLVREYAKNVESFSAASNKTMLDATKIAKNCWRIQTAGHPDITIKYRVYCFE